mgnify:CR=1 FL=1
MEKLKSETRIYMHIYVKVSNVIYDYPIHDPKPVVIVTNGDEVTHAYLSYDALRESNASLYNVVMATKDRVLEGEDDRLVVVQGNRSYDDLRNGYSYTCMSYNRMKNRNRAWFNGELEEYDNPQPAYAPIDTSWLPDDSDDLKNL